MSEEYLVKFGSIFAILAFVHFVVDWVFQTEKEALLKTKHWDVRAAHCFVYSSLMLLVIVSLFELTMSEKWYIFLILFGTHFIEDTYIPPYLWWKYVRKQNSKLTKEDLVKEWTANPMTPLLVIMFDQLVHIASLIPVVHIVLS